MATFLSDLGKYLTSGEGVGTFIVMLAGVLLAEYLAERHAAKHRRAEAKKAQDERRVELADNRAFVVSAIVAGLGRDLMSIHRDRHFLETWGQPNSSRMPVGHFSIDAFRVASALQDRYKAFTICHELVELTNAEFTTHTTRVGASLMGWLSSHHDVEQAAASYYVTYLPGLMSKLDLTEAAISQLLRELDPVEHDRIYQSELPLMKNEPSWIRR
jgi:hypothetical protein